SSCQRPPPGRAFIGTLHAAASRPDKEPHDKTELRQQQDQQNPQQFVEVGVGGLHHIDDGPDIRREDQKAEQAAYLNVHGVLLVVVIAVLERTAAGEVPTAPDNPLPGGPFWL